MVYDKDDRPLREVAEDYTTPADTFVPATTLVRVLAERVEHDEQLSLVLYEGTSSAFQIPTRLLREPYKERYPVKPSEDPLDSLEFEERARAYRSCMRGAAARIKALEEVKDFIRHYYARSK